MIILRQHNFSKSKNEKDEEEEEKNDKKRKLKGAVAVTAGALGTVGGIKGSKKLNNIAGDKALEAELKDIRMKYDRNKKDHKNVVDNLEKIADKLGIKIMKDENEDDAYNFKTDTINYAFDNPAVLAHEMGHAAMSKKGRSKDILGRAAHSKAGRAWGSYFDNATNINANDKEGKILKYGARGLFLGDGIRRGIKSSKQEESGNTKGAKRTRRNAFLISGLSAAPTLIAEASASRKGMKYLKEAGASKEILRNSRRQLGHSFGTYASMAGIPLALEAGGTAIGYGAHKLISKSKKKKEKEKDDNTKG